MLTSRINPGSALVMRTEPRYGSTPVARWGNRQWLEVNCWTTGDPDADGSRLPVLDARRQRNR